jgi:DNA-binding transcriptional MerR regulator
MLSSPGLGRGAESAEDETAVPSGDGGGGLRLLGCAEVAALCGVDRATIVRYQQEGAMPEPYARIAAGPIWLEDQINAWLARIEPLGLAELAALLGVHPSTIGRWQRRDRLPRPYTTLRCGRIWLRHQIEAWQPELFGNRRGRWRALPEHAKRTAGTTRSPRPLNDAAQVRHTILALRRKGWVPAAIADRLRIPDSVVARHLVDARRARRLQARGVPTKEIAEQLKLSNDAVTDYLDDRIDPSTALPWMA